MVALFMLASNALNREVGLAVGLIFAFHPLVLEFSTLMRGYALLLFAQALSWWFYHRALQTGARTAWWSGAGATMLALWAFPGYGYAALCLHGWLGLHLWRQQSRTAWRDWALAHSVAALTWLAVALPAFLDLLALMKQRYPFQSQHGLWALRMLTEGLSGINLPTYAQAPLGQPIDSWASLVATFRLNPTTTLFSWIIVPLLVCLGIRRINQSRTPWLASFMVATGLGALVAVGHQWTLHHEMLQWYGIYLVPVSCVSMASLIPSRPGQGVVAALAASGLFAWFTFPNGENGRLPIFPVQRAASNGYFHDHVALLSLADGRTLAVPLATSSTARPVPSDRRSQKLTPFQNKPRR